MNRRGVFEVCTAAVFVLLAAAARAQDPAPSPAPPASEGLDLLAYIGSHTSIVSGIQAADGVRSEFVSIELADDFEIAPRFRGIASLSLFSRARAGESLAEPGIPTSFDDLALYSSGEAQAGFYFQWLPKVAVECRGGVTFAMIGLTGSMGDPVDSSKFLGACGLRLTGGPGRLSVLAGHDGPVDEGAPFFGFAPSMIFDGEFRLPKDIAFVVVISAGRDLATQTAVTSSRFAVRKRF